MNFQFCSKLHYTVIVIVLNYVESYLQLHKIFICFFIMVAYQFARIGLWVCNCVFIFRYFIHAC